MKKNKKIICFVCLLVVLIVSMCAVILLFHKYRVKVPYYLTAIKAKADFRLKIISFVKTILPGNHKIIDEIIFLCVTIAGAVDLLIA